MQKLAIIGASDFQNPLILKAKERGIETHVFAWECGDIGERTADHFYPISTAEKDQILAKCREIDIDGICTIGSDFGNVTAAYVANHMGLTANSMESIAVSSNKHLMREAFAKAGDPSPRSILATDLGEASHIAAELRFPIIVKPTDRSGSRGITRLDSLEGLEGALESAFEVSFEHRAVVEEFVTGEEFSVEHISWEGEHHFLRLTKKFTSGTPHFIETGHFEPAVVSAVLADRIDKVVCHALDTLGIRYGASHAEVLVDAQGQPWIVEIGGRMGGDCIGSDLVELSSGIDFVGAVIDVALGREPDLAPRHEERLAAIRFVFGPHDLEVLESLRRDHPELLVRCSEIEPMEHEIKDSSSRYGFFIMQGWSLAQLAPYLPR